MVPGAAAADARVTREDGRDDWLLRQLGDGFTALVGHEPALERALRDVAVDGFALKVVAVGGEGLIDRDGDVARRYDLQPGTVVLLRPDAHVCARWRKPARAQVEAGMRRALAATRETTPCH